MLTLFTFLVGGPFFLTAGLLYVIQFSGNPLRGEQICGPLLALANQLTLTMSLRVYLEITMPLVEPTGMFIPTRKSDATSWSWWVNWFNFWGKQYLYITPLPLHFLHQKSLDTDNSFGKGLGGVGFAMSGFWEYFYGHIPLLEYRIQVLFPLRSVVQSQG